MGLIVCPIHGESGFTLRFSKRIIELINSDIEIDESKLRIFKINLIDDEDGEFLYAEQYLIFDDEFKKMNTEECVEATSEEGYDKYSNLLPKLSGICSRCLYDYKQKYNLSLLGFN